MRNRFLNEFKPALLALANGNIFSGIAIGASGQAVGEVVFNTAMTGYQEILTDPSYAEQIVTLTYPHIGNVGVNLDDTESSRVWVKGLVIRELSPLVSNWRAQQSLTEYLCAHNVVAIAGIDTRRLTRILREQGAQHGAIFTGDMEPNHAIAAAAAYAGLSGKDLAKEVTTQTTYQWRDAVHALVDNEAASATSTAATKAKSQYHVVVYDFGVKRQILRLLVAKGCQVTVVPAQTLAADVLALQPDGIVFANGPGDPAACDYAITAIQQLLKTSIPLLGICLGFQLLALACGAKTSKMKFGHHGANHPVQHIASNAVTITSQNHGFCVEESSLPSDLVVTYRSLFDGTLQGFKHRDKPIIAFQGHPEASPGPYDLISLFTDFINLMHRTSVNA